MRHYRQRSTWTASSWTRWSRGFPKRSHNCSASKMKSSSSSSSTSLKLTEWVLIGWNWTHDLRYHCTVIWIELYNSYLIVRMFTIEIFHSTPTRKSCRSTWRASWMARTHVSSWENSGVGWQRPRRAKAASIRICWTRRRKRFASK